jgi:putative restriction endonuclease
VRAPDTDLRFRLQAFEYLNRLTMGAVDALVTWHDLQRFQFEGAAHLLIGQRGIWKPRALEAPISITTSPPKPNRPAPYEDQIRPDDTLEYAYQGADPNSHDNAGLRRLMFEKRPLIYFHGIEKGLYLAAWPVYITADFPDNLRFIIDLSPAYEPAADVVGEGHNQPDTPLIPQHVFVPTKRRLHQARFRAQVMRAYRKRCAVCNLGHERLLDAAHIIPDSDARGTPVVDNGLSLCKIHHAAFDTNILGIDPDHVVHIREDILEEIDGPMLQHGIKDMHHAKLRTLPQRKHERPNREFLGYRFEEFRSA